MRGLNGRGRESRVPLDGAPWAVTWGHRVLSWWHTVSPAVARRWRKPDASSVMCLCRACPANLRVGRSRHSKRRGSALVEFRPKPPQCVFRLTVPVEPLENAVDSFPESCCVAATAGGICAGCALPSLGQPTDQTQREVRVRGPSTAGRSIPCTSGNPQDVGLYPRARALTATPRAPRHNTDASGREGLHSPYKRPAVRNLCPFAETVCTQGLLFRGRHRLVALPLRSISGFAQGPNGQIVLQLVPPAP